MHGAGSVVAAATLILGALTPGVSAKVASSCNLVTDKRGDGELGDSLDIVGADIGAAGGRLTAVIRLAGLSRVNPDAPTGQAWYLEWTVPGAGQPLYLGAVLTPTAERFEFGHKDQFFRPDGTATGVLDVDRREVRVTAPYVAWSGLALLKTGVRMSKIVVSTHWFVGATVADASAGSLQPGDDAATKRTFLIGTPSCVAVGR